MAITLSRQTAQKIVESIKDVCRHDINYIDTNGIIFASTDTARIGEFHEIGKKVAETKEIIEVESDNSFYGTLKGVNIPFLYNRELIAVIGISGEPESVRQYAVLAQKITTLILREHELDYANYGKRNEINFILHSLLENKPVNHEHLIDFLSKRNLSEDDLYRTVAVQLDARYNPSNLSMIENDIYNTFEHIPQSLYTFHYPNEYWLLVSEGFYEKNAYILEKLASEHQKIFKMGIGEKYSLFQQQHSLATALMAIQSLNAENNTACFDQLTLELLIGGVPDNIKVKYLEKSISKLKKEDIRLLDIYFSNNMSLQNTAAILFIHKNTVQYQLDRIQKITGCNPRNLPSLRLTDIP